MTMNSRQQQKSLQEQDKTTLSGIEKLREGYNKCKAFHGDYVEIIKVVLFYCHFF